MERGAGATDEEVMMREEVGTMALAVAPDSRDD